MRGPSATIAILGLAAGLAGPADASTVRYTDLLVFGDSLSDPGNLFAATGGAAPPSPPYDRRFSNGPVWAEYIAGAFEAEGQRASNYAFGGAGAQPLPDPGPFQIPDLGDQIGFFLADPTPLGARPVATILAGANNIFRSIESFVPDQEVLDTAAAAVEAVIGGIGTLAGAGIRDYFVFTLPPLAQTPAFSTFPGDIFQEIAGEAADTFNTGLVAALGALDPGLHVSVFDTVAYFEDLLADPGRLDLTDTTTPCYVPGSPPESRCSDEEAAGKLWFDTVHPTATVHADIGRQVGGAIAPVPLPPGLVLMLAGALALGLAARRRAG